jgi:hypothetical protein
LDRAVDYQDRLGVVWGKSGGSGMVAEPVEIRRNFSG